MSLTSLSGALVMRQRSQTARFATLDYMGSHCGGGLYGELLVDENRVHVVIRLIHVEEEHDVEGDRVLILLYLKIPCAPCGLPVDRLEDLRPIGAHTAQA